MMLFSDSVRFREIILPLKVTAEERAWLKQEAKKRGIRDVATLIRMCVRESLLSVAPQQPLKARRTKSQ